MHFLFLLLRLVLDGLIPSGRDGLAMAARADGRVEQLPLPSRLWERWLRFVGQSPPRGSRMQATRPERGDPARRRK